MKKKPYKKRQRPSKADRTPRRRRAGQVPIGASAAPGVSRVTLPGANVFADLGFEREEAENLKVRSDLMSEAQRLIDGKTQVRAAEMLGVSQPRISELRRGHIERFTIDALVNMLACAGVCVRISLTRKRRSVA